MRYLAVLSLTLPLQGCFFYIPGSVLSSLSGWNTCAGENVQVGQTITHRDGRIGKVEKISGRSERCQDGKFPILVAVNFDNPRGRSYEASWKRDGATPEQQKADTDACGKADASDTCMRSLGYSWK